MPFSSGFRTGYSIAESAKDRKLQEEQLRRFDEISRAKVEPIEQYQPEDIAQIQAMIDARDQQGNPYYRVDQNEAGNYTVQPNFSFEGQPRTPVEAIARQREAGAAGLVDRRAAFQSQVPIELAPQRRFQYLGQTYDQAPDEQQRMRAQTSAYADAVAGTDPRAALGLRRDQAQMDMAAEQHDWRRQDALYQQNERARAEGLRQGWQQRFGELNKVLETQGPKGLVDAVGGWFSQDGSGLPVMLTHDDKTGKIFMTSNVPGIGGRVKELSVPETFALAQGMFQMGNGDPQEGLKTILALERDKRAQAAQAAQANNQAVGLIDRNRAGLRDDARADQQLGISQANLGLRRQELVDNRAERAERSAQVGVQSTQYMEDDSGELVAVTPKYNKKTGQIEYNKASLGKGLRKPGTGPKTVEQEWQVIEKGLGNMPAEEVRARREEFLSSRGVAPPSALAIMRQPVNPQTGKPWSREDIEAFNRRFPKSKMAVPGNGATGSF